MKVFCLRLILSRSLLRSAGGMSPQFCPARLVWLFACCLLIIFHRESGAQEWARFRGTNGTGLSSAKTIPTHWTEKDFNWKVALPGSGHSSPVIWGEKIFLLSGDEDKGGVMVLCLSTRDGRLEWRKDVSFPAFRHHPHNSFGSSTPAVDAERVYVAWATPSRFTLAAFTHAGELAWERDLGPFASQHSGGTSPITYRDKVILANDQDRKSFLLAVAADTGKTVWETPRKATTTCYSTPCLYQPPGGKPLLIFLSQSHGFSAVDPESGKVVWEYPDAFDKRTVSSPVVASGLLIGSCGSGGGGNYVFALKPPASPREEAKEAYRIRRSAPYVPTSVAYGNLLFLWSDGGVVTCLDAPTGQTKYEERAGGNFFGSPILVDGRIFCVSTAGEVVVLAASDRFEVLARNSLNELAHTTPAVAGGRMYIRTSQHLLSIGGASAKNPTASE